MLVSTQVSMLLLEVEALTAARCPRVSLLLISPHLRPSYAHSTRKPLSFHSDALQTGYTLATILATS